MRVMRNIEWEYIEVGEVFALSGCWSIFEKVSETKTRFLATDCSNDFADEILNGTPGEICRVAQCRHGYWSVQMVGKINPGEYCYWSGHPFSDYPFYRLSVATQRLWKEE